MQENPSNGGFCFWGKFILSTLPRSILRNARPLDSIKVAKREEAGG